MRFISYLMILLLVLSSCKSKKKAAEVVRVQKERVREAYAEEKHAEKARADEHHTRENRALLRRPATTYPTAAYPDQVALTEEADSVKKILTTFSIQKIQNELVRRNPLFQELDSTLIDSVLFPIADNLLRNAQMFSRYKEKTGDTLYFNAVYDFRKDLWEVEDEMIRQNAKYIAMIVPTDYLFRLNGKYYMRTKRFLEFRGLCPSEKFCYQASSIFCHGSGFAVGPQYVVTALHSVKKWRDNVSVIFDFVGDESINGLIEIPTENMYFAHVTTANGGYDVDTGTYPGGDFAILKTDRPIPADRVMRLTTPDTLDQKNLYMIGHPDGLSLKVILDGRIVEEKDSLLYRSEMHSMPGCSGAPVFNRLDHKVVAMQLGMESGGDYVSANQNGFNCLVTRQCPSGECEGMDLVKIDVIIKALKKLD